MNNSDNNSSVKSKLMKKRILIVFAALIGFIVVFYLIDAFFDLDSIGRKKHTTYNPTKQTIIFYTPDYNEDINLDSIYMGYDRNIYIYDDSTGFTESLEPDDYEIYSDTVRFLADMIKAIIDGDADGYYKCFSNECFENGSVERKDRFTKQKLYNIQLSKKEEESISDKTYGNYTKYNYVVEYMIRQNNGTFRTDVGSDATLIQYITITDIGGEMKISDYSIKK